MTPAGGGGMLEQLQCSETSFFSLSKILADVGAEICRRRMSEEGTNTTVDG